MNAFVISDFERRTSLTLINTTDPAIYISKEFSSAWDFETGAGIWKWVAKRSWIIQGATRTETFEVPKEAKEADGGLTVQSSNGVLNITSPLGQRYRISKEAMGNLARDRAAQAQQATLDKGGSKRHSIRLSRRSAPWEISNTAQEMKNEKYARPRNYQSCTQSLRCAYITSRPPWRKTKGRAVLVSRSCPLCIKGPLKDRRQGSEIYAQAAGRIR